MASDTMKFYQMQEHKSGLLAEFSFVIPLAEMQRVGSLRTLLKKTSQDIADAFQVLADGVADNTGIPWQCLQYDVRRENIFHGAKFTLRVYCTTLKARVTGDDVLRTFLENGRPSQAAWPETPNTYFVRYHRTALPEVSLDEWGDHMTVNSLNVELSEAQRRLMEQQLNPIMFVDPAARISDLAGLNGVAAGTARPPQAGAHSVGERDLRNSPEAHGFGPWRRPGEPVTQEPFSDPFRTNYGARAEERLALARDRNKEIQDEQMLRELQEFRHEQMMESPGLPFVQRRWAEARDRYVARWGEAALRELEHAAYLDRD